MVTNTLITAKSNQVEKVAVLDQEEVDQVLTALRTLKGQVTSPVVKDCLEAARWDIAHLAAAGDMPEDDEFEDADDELDYEE